MVWSLGAQTPGPALPEGKGRAQTQRICGMCHDVQMAVHSRHSKEAWSGIVDDMVSRGAQGTDDDFELVLRYLAANFGPKAIEEGDSRSAAGQKIAINNAAAKEIADSLGLSEKDAGAIVEYRAAHGAFKEWADLEKVTGIDLKKLESQKDRIVFTPASANGK